MKQKGRRRSGAYQRGRARTAAGLKRKRRARTFAAASLVLLFALGIMLALVFFIRVDKIQISGKISAYTQADVRDSSGVELGDSMILVSCGRVERNLLENLPYLSDAEVERGFDGVLHIRVEESRFRIALSTESGYQIFNENFRLIEKVSAVPVGVILISGITPETIPVGSALDTESIEGAKQVLQIADLLTQHGLIGMTCGIDVTDLLNITVNLDNRIFVMIGTVSNIEYKIEMLAETVLNRLEETAYGELDVSIAGKAVYSPTDRFVEDLEGE